MDRRRACRALYNRALNGDTITLFPGTFKDCQDAASARRGRQRTNPPARGTYMEGTVASYSGTTLVMNITTTARLGHMEILVDSFTPDDYDRDWFREGNMPVRSSTL